MGRSRSDCEHDTDFGINNVFDTRPLILLTGIRARTHQTELHPALFLDVDRQEILRKKEFEEYKEFKNRRQESVGAGHRRGLEGSRFKACLKT